MGHRSGEYSIAGELAEVKAQIAQLLAALEASERENERLTGALREIAYSPKALPMGIRPLARHALATAPNTKDGER